jgi:hypothetical protein
MVKNSFRFKFILVLLIPFFLFACKTTQPEETGLNNRLTTGEVKRQIVKGETNQAEIIRIFGSPNLVTKNKQNKEVWSYNKMSYEKVDSSKSGALFGFTGQALGAASGSKAVSTSSSKSFDLIITFDTNDVVEDYSVISASY